MIYTHIDQLIGSTPLMLLPSSMTGLKHIDVYAKLEYLNPFGSLKDRIAKHMLAPIKEEMQQTKKTVIEASSGNTGKALATLCSMEGIPFKAVTNRIKIQEMRLMMQVTGATLEELPGLSDCPDLSDPNSYTTAAHNMAVNEPDTYHYTDQYFNERNWQAHLESGKEILAELGSVDLLFTMLGTTGSSVGIGRACKEINPDLQNYAIVAEAGQQIPGARNSNELWEVGFYDPDFYTEILTEHTYNSIDGAIELLRGAGIYAGPTAGATYKAMLAKLHTLDTTYAHAEKKPKAVFIVCDRMEPYLNFFRTYRPELFSTQTSSRPRVSTTHITDTALQIDPHAVHEHRKNYTVIDIRGNFPFSIGHVNNSINIIDETFAQMIEEGPVFPKQQEIVVACRIGDISQKYAQFLRNQGYIAYSLRGGIISWKQQGLPLDTFI